MHPVKEAHNRALGRCPSAPPTWRGPRPSSGRGAWTTSGTCWSRTRTIRAAGPSISSGTGCTTTCFVLHLVPSQQLTEGDGDGEGAAGGGGAKIISFTWDGKYF
ncbi:hypothetical protein MAPG_09686 [Magnaporthiopsis poae ATCC 64411]|uniref:Uncharacterized protein n=1 Tax=Magnaporthiopsis poae (strain ATCC 64411 / 73-15) TaxID=644358 RepID=A0A0C4EAL1_MAGP6|nr:hypothetical protein MAPG_09686 [Magnaporthiopsis poae ATCC 64411]